MELYSKKKSPNNGILVNGVLRHRLLNIPFASCSFINLVFLLSHIAHFVNNIISPLLVFETFGFILAVYFFTL